MFTCPKSKRQNPIYSNLIMEEQVEQQVVVTGVPVDAGNTKTVFGAVSSPSPIWAKWMFRVIAILTTAICFWVAGTNLIQTGSKTEIMLALKVVDMLALGFSNMFGIVPTETV